MGLGADCRTTARHSSSEPLAHQAAAEEERLEDLLDTALVEAGRAGAQQAAVARLFRGLVFFLSRETPRDALAFAIRSCGGEARTLPRAKEGFALPPGREAC